MDKLEKVRKEIERRIQKLEEAKKASADDNMLSLCNTKILALYGILNFIDSMQEECKFKVGDRIRLQGTTAIGDVITNIYTSEDDKVYFEFENSDDALADLNWELVEWSKKCMYANDNYTDEERRVLCKDCDEECEYAKKKVLVSEELEDAAYQFVMDNFGNPKEPLYKFDQRCFKAGANWQRQKDEHLISANYEKGIEEGKQQMMNDAVEAVVQTNSMSGNTAVVHLDCKYIAGDKVRVIIIKDE